MRRKKPQYVTAVELLTIAPSDRLVVTCAERLSQKDMKHMADAMAAFARIDADRVLVVTNARVSVLREGEPPPPPVAAFPEIAEIGS